MQRPFRHIITLLFFTILPTQAATYLVVPFFNVSKAANLDWIGESIAETVLEALVSKEVVALTREEREEACRRLSLRCSARLTRASVVKLGKELDAGVVVYGEFEWTPAQDSPTPSRGALRMTAAVLDLERMALGPEFAESGAMEDLSSLQTRLAWKLLRFARPKDHPSEEEFFQSHAPVRIDAIENHVRGLLATTAEQKHRFFAQAARLDNNFSQPRFQLGRMQYEEKNYRVAAQWLEQVIAADSRYLEASFLLGLCRYFISDYKGALAAFETVERAAPLNEVYNNMGAAQSRLSQPEALANLLKAVEGDPADPDYQFNAGYVLWRQGDFGAAAERFQAVLDRNPEDAEAVQMLGRCLKQSGPRPGELKSEGLERLKTNHDETAHRQYRASQDNGGR